MTSAAAAVVPVAGFVSQKLTDPDPAHWKAKQDINVGYKWHHSTWARQGETLSADAKDAPRVPGVQLDGGVVLKSSARDHVTPMLNFKNAETLAKLVHAVALTEQKSSKPWRVRDICPIHGTTTAAFFQYFQEPLSDLSWCPSTSKALAHEVGKEKTPPIRPVFKNGDSEGLLRPAKAYWPALAALHGRVVAEAVASGAAYVKAYPELAHELRVTPDGTKLLQGQALEKRVDTLDHKREITHTKYIPIRELDRRRQALDKMIQDGAESDHAIRSTIQFLVEALLTRQYSERDVVSCVTWIIHIAYVIARLPHGTESDDNPVSAAAMAKTVAALDAKDPRAGRVHRVTWSPSGRNAEKGVHQAVHVTVDCDVHSEHARYNLWYLHRCLESISNAETASILSFVLPRRFRCVKVDFTRRCSLSSYLFHHLRYFDANAVMDNSKRMAVIQKYHDWCSEQRFNDTFAALFQGPEQWPPKTNPDPRATTVLAWPSRDRGRVSFCVDQGPLRFVLVYKPSHPRGLETAARVLVTHLHRIASRQENQPSVVDRLEVSFKAAKASVSGTSLLAKGDPVGTRNLFLILQRVFAGFGDPAKEDQGTTARIRGTVDSLRDALFFAHNPSNAKSTDARDIRARFDALQELYEIYTQKKQAASAEAPVLDLRFSRCAWTLIEQILDTRMALSSSGPIPRRRPSPRRADSQDKSTHGGFWKVNAQGGRDRMYLAPHPLYKFKGRFPAINLDALSFDLQDPKASIATEPVTAERARRMAALYRLYVLHRKAVSVVDPDRLVTFLDGIHQDSNRAVLSYSNTRRLASLCSSVFDDAFAADTKELSDALHKSWGFPVLEKQEKKTVAPLWVVYQPGYGSATLALHEAGYRVTELNPISDFRDGGGSSSGDERAPKYIMSSARGNVPTGRMALVRIAILVNTTHAVISPETVYSGPLANATHERITTLFDALYEGEYGGLSENVKRLLTADASSFILFHLNIANYDNMVEGLSPPVLNARHTLLLTNIVEHLCKHGIRKVIVVPMPTADRGDCSPFHEMVRVPEGSLKFIRVPAQSLDFLFIFTWMFNDAEINAVRDRLSRAYATPFGH